MELARADVGGGRHCLRNLVNVCALCPSSRRVGVGTDPKYLLRRAPYTFTRNPMYLAELALWLGWAIFYGSVTVFLGFLVVGLVLHYFVVPWGERTLAARFDENWGRSFSGRPNQRNSWQNRIRFTPLRKSPMPTRYTWRA